MAKNSSITLSITPEQKQIWQEWADKKDMTLSAFIRRCVSVCIMAYEKKESK